MKLTAGVKVEFLNSVLSAIRSRDFGAEVELVWEKIVVTKMPPMVASIYNDPLTRTWVDRECIYTARQQLKAMSNQGKPLPVGVEKLFREIERIENDRSAHATMVDDIRTRISTAMNSVTTVLGLSKLFPQYVSYLPLDAQRPTKEAAKAALSNLGADIFKLNNPQPAPSPTTKARKTTKKIRVRVRKQEVK